MARKDYKQIEYTSTRVVWRTFPEICKSCGLCIEKCPVKCLSYDLEKNEYLGMPAVKNNVKECIACGTCERVCPDCAITVDKKK